jgi:hypothetical protein
MIIYPREHLTSPTELLFRALSIFPKRKMERGCLWLGRSPVSARHPLLQFRALAKLEKGPGDEVLFLPLVNFAFSG